jgi:hypothetical protein
MAKDLCRGQKAPELSEMLLGWIPADGLAGMTKERDRDKHRIPQHCLILEVQFFTAQRIIHTGIGKKGMWLASTDVGADILGSWCLREKYHPRFST